MLNKVNLILSIIPIMHIFFSKFTMLDFFFVKKSAYASCTGTLFVCLTKLYGFDLSQTLMFCDALCNVLWIALATCLTSSTAMVALVEIPIVVKYIFVGFYLFIPVCVLFFAKLLR